MTTLTLSTNQVSQITFVPAGSRITSTGNGSIEWTPGSPTDAANSPNWQTWAKGSSAGYMDTLRPMSIRATATGAMTVTIEEGRGDKYGEDAYFDADYAQYSVDASGNTVLVGADGKHIYLGPIANVRPNFEVSGTATETEAARIQIPGGLLKPNSAVQITTLWQLDGADSKNLYMRAGDDATMTYGTSLRIGSYNGLTTQKSVGFTLLLHNNGSTGAQIAVGNGASQPFGVASTAVPVEVAVNTALDWSIYLGALNSVVGAPVNKCILKSVIVEIK